MDTIKLFFQFLKINIKSIAQHRGSFVLYTLSKAVYFVSSFIMLWIMIQTFNAMGDWSAYEIMFLYAIANCGYAIGGSFLYHGCNTIGNEVRDGSFDMVLTKPVDPFVFWTSTKYSSGYFGTFIVSLSVIFISLYLQGVQMSFVKILFLTLTLLSAGVIIGAIMLLTTVPCFWIVKNKALMSIAGGGMRSFIDYPISIYNRLLQVILTFVLPYAFVNFFPAQLILSKNDFLMFPPVFQYLAPVVATLVFIIAYRLWKFGINHYQSTGS